jgi:O-antigen/teichoic acid export membrane protein
MLRENLKNLTYQSLAQILPRAIMLLFTFYLISILGSVEYGKFDFALSFAYMVAVFFELGGNILLTKYVARGLYSSFKLSMRFRILSILITMAVLFAVLKMFDLYENKRILILYATLGIAFSSLMNLFFSFYRGIKKMNYEAVVSTVQKVIFVLLTLALIQFSKAGELVLISFGASMVISYLLIQSIYLKQKNLYVQDERPGESLETKSFIKDIVGLALISVFSVIYFRATQIILEHFWGFHEVGVYGASYKIIEAIISVPLILMIVMFPDFARLARSNLDEFRHLYFKLLKFLSVFGVVISLIVWFAGDYVFLLFGKDYGSAGIVLKFLLIALLALFPNTLLTQVIIALDLNIQYATALLVVLVLNLALSYLIVPSMGAVGSAISVGICEWVISIWCFVFVGIKLREVGQA